MTKFKKDQIYSVKRDCSHRSSNSFSIYYLKKVKIYQVPWSHVGASSKIKLTVTLVEGELRQPAQHGQSQNVERYYSKTTNGKKQVVFDIFSDVLGEICNENSTSDTFCLATGPYF
jgi:hypothetical protein